MKNKTLLCSATLLVFLAIFVGAYIKGRDDVWEIEFKACAANMQTLTSWETNQPPELKVYVKARYYHLANRVAKNFVGQPKDFGAVSTNISQLTGFKGPISGQAEYLIFKERFGLSKSTA